MQIITVPLHMYQILKLSVRLSLSVLHYRVFHANRLRAHLGSSMKVFFFSKLGGESSGPGSRTLRRPPVRARSPTTKLKHGNRRLAESATASTFGRSPGGTRQEISQEAKKR